MNIAMHAPHEPARYIDLLRAVSARQLAIRSGDVHRLMLGPIYREDDGVSGEIFRFIKLDPNEPWFNALTQDVAEPEDLQAVKIPDHLLPHLQVIPFVFRSGTHRMYFVSRNRTTRVSPAAVKSFLEVAFSHAEIAGDFPEVNVTVIPEKETLERIFAMHSLERLTIELVRPNADDGWDDEARWLERLQRQGSKKLTVELVSERNGSLTPDQETRTLAAVAADNGKVSAEGRDAGGVKQRESTVEKPLIESVVLNPEIQLVFDVLRDTATALDLKVGARGENPAPLA